MQGLARIRNALTAFESSGNLLEEGFNSIV